MPVLDVWKPTVYESFNEIRKPAINELLRLIHAKPNMHIIDVGCGSGDFTGWVRDALKPAGMVAFELSEQMLQAATARGFDNVNFRSGDINTFDTAEKFDLVFSNGVFQYAHDRDAVLTRFRSWLEEGGQLAIQFPHNRDVSFIAMGWEIAQQDEFVAYIDNARWVFEHGRRGLDTYTRVLHKLGFRDQVVKLQSYAHPMRSGQELLDWLEQTYLHMFEEDMPAPLFAKFRREYTWRFAEMMPLNQPCLYVLNRLYLWARL